MFTEVLNVFVVGFNHVIIVLLTTDEIKICIKRVEKKIDVSDVYVFWN